MRAIFSGFVLNTVAVTAASACSPAPSCWLEEGPSYVRTICKGYAQKGRSVADIRGFVDEPDKVQDFVRACKKYGVTFKEAAGAPISINMPIDFVGDWCSPTKYKGQIDYTLPSWTDDGKCNDILSVGKFEFRFADKKISCRPESIHFKEDTAPSGTAYIASIKARCVPDGEVTPDRWTHHAFNFSRYKGRLTITLK